MKSILILFLLFSFAANAQIVTLSTKARNCQYLAGFVKSHDEDTTYINLLNRWCDKFRVANAPTGTTQVSVDSISIQVVAGLYSKALSAPQGTSSVGDDFKADIATIRTNTPALDALLDAIDAAFAAELSYMRTRGRKILTGTNQ
jgi:hypothetical protein